MEAIMESSRRSCGFLKSDISKEIPPPPRTIDIALRKFA
jgi:hypothetical protein